jgi:hypothetical protein
MTLLLLWNCQTEMPPAARDDAAATDRNVPVTITVLANDTASTGRIMASTVAVVVGPGHGAAHAQADGTVIYTPATDFVGTDSFSYVVTDTAGEISNAATVTVTVRAVNRAPVASAGPDTNAVTGQPVTLDGAQSFDPDHDLLTYAWQFIAVPPTSAVTTASLVNAQTAAPHFIPDVDGTYILELTVSDGTLSSTDQVQVTAGLPNVRPNANAGQPQTAQVGTAVLLDGTGSNDPDNGPQPLIFLWSFIVVPPGSALSSADIQGVTTPLAHFTPDAPGVYRVGLQVSDGHDASQVEVQVTTTAPPNVAPNAQAGQNGPPIVVQLGNPVTLDGTTSNDPDNGPQPLTYQWTLVSTPATSGLTNTSIQGATTATPSFTPDVAGIYVLRLDVSDGELTSFAQVMLKANAVPIAVDDSFDAEPNQTLTVPAPGVLVNDTDGNNDFLTVVLGNTVSHGTLTLTADGSFTYIPTTGFSGTDSFTYQANDGSVDSNMATVTITVQQGSFAAITLTPNPLTLNPSTTGSVTVALTRPVGPAGQVVTLLSSNSAVASVPPSVTVPANASSTTVTVTAGSTLGTTTLNASATGLTGGSTTVNVGCPTITVTLPGVTSGTINVPFSQSFSQSGAVGTATFTIASGTLPTGLTLASSGLLTGTPTQTGSFPITVRVTDSTSCTATSATYTLTIRQVPVITSANATTLTVGTAGIFTVTTTGFPPPSIARGGVSLPGGVTFVDNGNGTGTLSGTPAAGTGGTYALTFTATNAVGASPVQAFTLTVNQAPAITSADATTFTVGTAGMFSVTATGVPTPTFAVAGTLPTGVTLSPTGLLSGIPGPGTAGMYALTFTASNGAGSPAMQTFTLTVVCTPITVDPVGSALTDGTFSIAYSQTFTASGGTTPHSFAVTQGAIPLGLMLASGGELTGSPTDTGNFSFTVTATDVNLCKGSTAYTLLVRPNAQPESFANGVGNTQYVVGLAAPATPAVVVAGLVLANDAGPGLLSAGPDSITTTHGGSVAMHSNGSFTYTPPVGFAGPSDTFDYTLTDGKGNANTARVTINLSHVVWYVNSNSANSDGRSHSPFPALGNAEAASAAGHTIFVHTGAATTSGSIALKTGQTLWGQGTTFTLNGLTIGATGKPTVTGTITLATNATVSSLDINTGASTGITNPASAITGVHITNGVTVTTTTGPAVSLSDTDGTLTFQRISAGTGASGPTNGISLTNTTGSFTVTGDGASDRNGTGGTITNTIGDGISLTNVAHASFSRMNITDSGANGIFGTGANGFVLVVDWCSISNTQQDGIHVDTTSNPGVNPGPNFSVTVTNNEVRVPVFSAISLTARVLSNLCFNVLSNTIKAGASGVLIADLTNGAVSLEKGMPPSLSDTAEDVLRQNNTDEGSSEDVSIEGNVTVVDQCPTLTPP